MQQTREINLGKRGVSVLFFAMAALLVASIGLMYWAGLIALDSNRRVDRQREIIQGLEEILSTLKDAETGQRGYLLTGVESYLEPYLAAVRQVEGEISELQRLIRAGDLPRQETERVVDLARQTLAELRQTIDLRREQGLPAALNVVLAGRGKQLMDEVRVKVDDLRSGEEAEYSQASRQAQRIARVRTGLFVGVGLLNLAFLDWVFRRLSREREQREAARREIERQKELLSTTLASIGDGVIVTDAQGDVTFLNGEAERLTGWKGAEARGKAFTKVFRIIDEHTRQPADNPVAKVLRSGKVAGLANHTVLLTRDGREVPIDDSGAPVRQGDGRIEGVVLVFRDITQRKQAEAELRRAKDQLAHANANLELLVQERTARLEETVEELEHFSYTITHDMRAPLRAMQGFAGLLEDACGRSLSPEDHDYLRRIVTAAARMDRLITDALNYSKALKQQLALGPVDAAALLRGMVDSYPAFQPPQAQIRIEGRLPFVLANEAGLTQCFSNLLGNAVKFVQPGKVPHVRIWAELRSAGSISESSGDSESSVSQAAQPPEPSANPFVRIWFEDNGLGIPKEALDRIFNMFQRVSKAYEGTGIGLALVRKVAERMGGKVGVESEPGQGSRFWLELRSAQ